MGVTSKDFLLEKDVLSILDVKTIIKDKSGNFSVLEALAVC